MRITDRNVHSDRADRWTARLADALATEYGIRFERHLRWLRSPLAVLTLALIAAALCGLFLHPQGLVFAFGLAAVLAVGVA